MTFENTSFPISGKLIYCSEEIRLNTLGIYSEFGNTIQGLTNEHIGIPELYSTTQLDQFISQNAAKAVEGEDTFTTIEELFDTASKNPNVCYKYQTNNIVFVVTPELRSVYRFETGSKTQTMIDSYVKTIPVTQTPEIRLIGKLYEDSDMYRFKSEGLKMRILLKSGREVQLTATEPAVTLDYYSEYM